MKNMIKKVTLLVISLIILAYPLNAGKNKNVNSNDNIRLRNGCLSFSGFRYARYVDDIKLEQALQQILQQEEKTRELNLEYCNVKNINLNNLIYLKELRLTACDYLEKLNINNCPNLKIIMIDYCLFGLQEIIINKCPKLRTLDIYINDITNQQPDRILDQVGQTLNTLYVSNCKNLYHINLNKCPNVDSLRISECKLNNIEEINTIVEKKKIRFSHD